MSLNIIGRGPRGLAIFGDWPAMWHGQVKVQESSAAFKGACVWIFCERAYSNIPTLGPPHLHFQYKDAVELRNALNRFIAAVKDGDTIEGADSKPDTIG